MYLALKAGKTSLFQVAQWVQEIEAHTAKGSVRVLQYTGAKRALNKPDFNKYDFAVTTYSTLEADYRRHIMPPKIRCQYCHKLFYPDKMKVHLTYFCGPDALRTEKQAKQKSKSWGDKKRTRKGKKSGGVDDDDEDLEELEQLATQSRGKSPLHSVRWERIILDEVIIRCPVYVLLLHSEYYCFNNTINFTYRCIISGSNRFF
jgi:DNA repair protein RAD16